MLFIVSLQTEGENVAKPGELIVPWFPNLGKTTFISLDSWLFASLGEVAEVDVDLDELSDRLHSQFPGIPKLICDRYVLETAVAANSLPKNKRLRVAIVDEGKSTIIQTTDGKHSITLWSEHPK